MDKKIANRNCAVKKYEIAHSKKLGRYLVAAKNLSPGEVIFREDALAVGPSIFEASVFCFSCLRPLPGYKAFKTHHVCTKCGVAPLCNRLCEDSVGLHSTRECNVFSEKKNLCLENLDELVRILLHLRLWLIKNDDNNAWDKVMSMEAHLNERRNTDVWQDRETNVIDIFRKFDLHNNKDDESLQQLCGIIDVNTFELRSPGDERASGLGSPDPLLRGIFLVASLMAHECRAKAHVSVDDKFCMTVHAAVSMEAGDAITFNYTSPLLGTIDRQEHLQEGKYFRCDCNTCKDPLEDGSYLSCILCPRCKKDYVAIQKTTDKEPYGKKTKWQCQKCKRIYRGCLVKSTIDISKRLINEVDYNNVKVMENLHEKLSRTFHKNHFVMLLLKQKILASYRKEMMSINPQRKVLQKMIELGKELLQVLEIVEPGISTLKGILLYEMHLPIAILANRDYAGREITALELHDKLNESQGYLKRSLTMLLLEPPNSPEGLLAKRALQEMRLLSQNVDDAKALSMQFSTDIKNHENGHRHQKKHRNKVIKRFF